jgi:hypothetical protein
MSAAMAIAATRMRGHGVAAQRPGWIELIRIEQATGTYLVRRGG